MPQVALWPTWPESAAHRGRRGGELDLAAQRDAGLGTVDGPHADLGATAAVRSHADGDVESLDATGDLVPAARAPPLQVQDLQGSIRLDFDRAGHVSAFEGELEDEVGVLRSRHALRQADVHRAAPGITDPARPRARLSDGSYRKGLRPPWSR